MMKRLKQAMLVTLLASAAYASVSYAEEELPNPLCQDANILSGSLITDVCWECIFPMRIAGMEMGDPDGRPAGSSDQALCNCPDDLGVPQPGFVTSYYEPARLVETVQSSGCSPSLGGLTLPMSDARFAGYKGGDTDGDQSDGGFYHAHYFAFPLLAMLEVWVGSTCNSDGYSDFDLMFISEVDPTWNNDLLATYTTPEAAAFANPLALSVCAADAIAATAGYPQDNLFWCLGAEGAYPFAGHFNPSGSFALNATLVSTKMLAQIHRRGFARKTMGDENLCYKNFAPMLPKSQYKWGMMYPVADGDNSYLIGESDAEWGAGKSIPGKTDAVHLLYRYNDCCVH